MKCIIITLKRVFTKAPDLARPEFAKVFKVQMNASDLGIGAVLTQEHEHNVCK